MVYGRCRKIEKVNKVDGGGSSDVTAHTSQWQERARTSL